MKSAHDNRRKREKGGSLRDREMRARSLSPSHRETFKSTEYILQLMTRSGKMGPVHLYTARSARFSIRHFLWSLFSHHLFSLLAIRAFNPKRTVENPPYVFAKMWKATSSRWRQKQRSLAKSSQRSSSRLRFAIQVRCKTTSYFHPLLSIYEFSAHM